MAKSVRRGVYAIVITMGLLLTGLYFFQESLIFPAQQLPGDFQFESDIPFSEGFLEAKDGARLNFLRLKAKEPKGIKDTIGNREPEGKSKGGKLSDDQAHRHRHGQHAAKVEQDHHAPGGESHPEWIQPVVWQAWRGGFVIFHDDDLRLSGV